MLGFSSPQPLKRLCLALSAGVLLAGCLGREDSRSSTDRQLALDKATQLITDAGYSPANYLAEESYDPRRERWTILFHPNAKPRPPGGDLIVWVNLATGETKLMHGQ